MNRTFPGRVSPLEKHMAYTALPAPSVPPLTSNDAGTPPSREKINFTALSMFQACLMAGVIVVPIWAAIGLMLAR